MICVNAAVMVSLDLNGVFGEPTPIVQRQILGARVGVDIGVPEQFFGGRLTNGESSRDRAT